MDLMTRELLPTGFECPREFLRIVELKLVHLEPWSILDREEVHERMVGLRTRYPGRVVVPFAARQDRDDMACWDLAAPDRVSIIHDHASPGWEDHGSHPSFYAWLRVAVEDLVEFDDE